MNEMRAASGLTPSEDERQRHVYLLQAVRVPFVRLLGFLMVALAVGFHNALILGDFSRTTFALFTAGLVTYCLTSWLFLHFYYRRSREQMFDVAWAFHVFDVVACTVAICVSGGERSWLFFIVLVPIWNQTYASARRAFFSGVTASVTYLAVLLLLRHVEQRPIDMRAAAFQASLILGVAAYCTMSAAIVERNRRRYAQELRDARIIAEQKAVQLAALNRMTQTVTSNAELQPMLDAVAKEILTFLNASSCAITMLDRRRGILEVAACRSIRSNAPDVRGFAFPVELNPACATAIASRRAVIVTNAQTNPLTAITHDALRALGVQCLMSVPIVTGGEVIGTVSIHTDDPARIFTDAEAEMATMAASQVAAPINNARLYQEEKRSRELAERLQSVGRAVTTSLDLDEVLRSILHHIHEVIPCHGGSIQLIEDGAMHVVAVHGYPQSDIGRARRLDEYPLNSAIAESRRSLIIGLPSPLMRDEKGEFGDVKTILGVPLIVNDRVIGAMILDSHNVQAYDEVDSTAAMAFGRFASMAVEHARLYTSMQEMAILDPLTRISNRRHFDNVLEMEWRRGLRNASSFSLIMIDVDNFKAYNDRYGHPAGDVVLQKVANELRGTLQRAGDLVARYGGEEFIALLPGADEVAAMQRGEALRRRIERLGISHEGTVTGGVVTISVGIASTVATPDTDPASLIAAADRELYAAKRSDRNQVSSSIASSSRLPISRANRPAIGSTNSSPEEPANWNAKPKSR